MNKKTWVYILVLFSSHQKISLWSSLTGHSVCSSRLFHFMCVELDHLSRSCSYLWQSPELVAMLKRCWVWCRISSTLFFSCVYLYLLVDSVVTEYMRAVCNDLIRIISVSGSISRIISVCCEPWNPALVVALKCIINCSPPHLSWITM